MKLMDIIEWLKNIWDFVDTNHDVLSILFVIPTVVLSLVAIWISHKAFKASSGKADRPLFDNFEVEHDYGKILIGGDGERYFACITLTNIGNNIARDFLPLV